MYYGIVESESLNNPLILDKYKVKKVVTEFQPNAKTKQWHIFILEILDDSIFSLVKEISSEIKYGWYAIFWNDIKTYVVFSNKVFDLKKEQKWLSKGYEAVREYGSKNGVQKEYLDFNKNFVQYNKLIEDSQ